MILTKIILILLFVNLISSQKLISSNIKCNNIGCQQYCNTKKADKGICNEYNFCVCDGYKTKQNADFDLYNTIIYNDDDKDYEKSLLGSCNNINDGNIDLKVKSTESNFNCKTNINKSYGVNDKKLKFGKILSCDQKVGKNYFCLDIINECEKAYGGNWNPTGKCIKCLEHNQVLEKYHGNIGCCKSNGILTTGKDGITKCFVGGQENNKGCAKSGNDIDCPTGKICCSGVCKKKCNDSY